MRRLMVHVHKCPLDIRQNFDLVLQLLTDVMRFPQRCSRVHHDVHLHEIVLEAKSCTPLVSKIPSS